MSAYGSGVQVRNPQKVDILRTDFQHRNEPNFAWKSAASTLQEIPALIGAWPTSILRLDNAADRVRDIGGGGYHLTHTGGLLLSRDGLAPYIWFDGATGRLSRVAGAASWASVRGNEGYIDAGIRGLTVGGWIRTGTIAAGTAGICSKWTVGNQRTWLLRRSAAAIQWYVSANGAAGLGPATLNVSADTWYFVAARWIPDAANSMLKLWVNDDTNENNIGAAATLFDSTADFFMGVYDGAANFWSGRMSHLFFSASALGDTVIFNLYQQQRAMFGV